MGELFFKLSTKVGKPCLLAIPPNIIHQSNMKIKRLPNLKFEKKLIPEIGSKIKSAREECGLSQGELAEIIGFKSAVPISLYETNKRRINAIRLWQISQVVNMPINYFL